MTMGDGGLSDDGTRRWNPTGGPNGTGAYEPLPNTSPSPSFTAGGGPPPPAHQFVNGAWGGSGNSLNADGTENAGTSGAAQDVDRYRKMGQNPVHTTGPQIDQSQSGQSRGISMGALGLLGQTAAGQSPSAAEQLGTQMGQRAQAAQFSLGASVRGGAGARAAANRNATMNAAVIGGQTLQSNAATRAGEMAGARDAYFGAASGQRSEDLGAATSQANLDMGQKVANDQREGNYEDMGQNVKGSELSHDLGRTSADDAAANQAKSLQAQADQASTQRTNQNISTGVGGLQGGIKAYGQSGGFDPDDPNHTTSDGQAKTNVKPMGTARDRVMTRGQVKTNNPYDEYDRSMYGRSDEQGSTPNTEALHAGIERRLAADGDIDRKDPYVTKSLFGARPGEQADRGYAASRAGKPGAMFGGPAPQASYGSLRDIDEDGGAPGTADARLGEGHGLRKKDRDISMSDEKTKQAAQDAEETRKFMEGTTPVARDDSKEARDKAAYEKREGDHLLKEDQEKAERAPKIEYANAADARAKGEASKLDGVPFFGKWAANIAASHDKESDAVKAARADTRKANELEIAATRRRADAWAASKLPESVRDASIAAPVGVGARPGRQMQSFTRDTTLSPAEAKDHIVPLYEDAASGVERHWDTDVAKAPPDAMSGASLSGPAPRFGHQSGTKPAPAPEAKAKHEATRKLSPDEMKRMADEMLGSNQAQHEMLLGAGPSAGERTPPAWLDGYMRSDEKTKTGIDKSSAARDFTPPSKTESPMAQANRSMAPHSYEYKPEFTPPEQQPGEKNVGPMANAMNADPVAKTAIVTHPKTGLLAIDKTKGLKLVMGGLADLQRQVDGLGGRKRA